MISRVFKKLFSFFIEVYLIWASQVALVVKNLPANAGDVRDVGSIPGSGRSSGKGHGNPLQYSCLENPMDRNLVSHTESDTAEETWNDGHMFDLQNCVSSRGLPW